MLEVLLFLIPDHRFLQGQLPGQCLDIVIFFSYFNIKGQYNHTSRHQKKKS